MFASGYSRGIAVFIFCIFALFLAQVALGWTGPTNSPPNGNVAAPINVGSTAQTKDGTLGVNGLAVFGNTLLSGSSRYLNWGSTAGSTGYGIRDNGGTLEYKNSGGNWTGLGTVLGWVISGNNIYNSNSANVGIGTASPGQKLDVSGTARATAFVYSSDARLKEDIQKLSDGLEKALALSPVTFRWNAKSGREGQGDVGFIAQDVEKIIPEAVHEDTDGMKSVDYVRLVPILVGAIQEQQEEIEVLKARLDALEAK